MSADAIADDYDTVTIPAPIDIGSNSVGTSDEALVPLDEWFGDEDEEEGIKPTKPYFVKEVVEALKKVRDSDYYKYVMKVMRTTHTQDDVVGYPMGNSQLIQFFFNLNEINGTLGHVPYRRGLKHDFGDGRSIETQDKCDFDKTIPKLVEEFHGNCYIYPVGKTDVLFAAPGLVATLYSFGINIISDPTDKDTIYRTVNCIQWLPMKRTKMVDYVVYDQSFHTTSLQVRKQECDVKTNYNDDLPDERIVNWINSNEAGLTVLHGEPGTGKTSYIRNLIYRTDKRFMFFDKSLFQHMTDSSLIDMLLEHRDSVIVLEDCEDLLTDRTGFGSCMGTILNLTDGILGDSMRFKFICTFNANIVEIDPAILRKGRMRLKYEFKKLTADKAQALGKKLGFEVPHKEMPLCDVYNYEVDNGKPIDKGKMGF